MSATDELLQHLKDVEAMVRPRSGEENLWSFILRNAKTYAPPAKPRPEGVPKMRDKHCFENALKLATDHEADGWQYCEGYATSIIPMEHAWVVTPEGKVIDPTWKDAGVAYVGIAMKPTDVWRILCISGTYGVLVNMHNPRVRAAVTALVSEEVPA